MIEGAHLILNPVLLVYKGSSQQGFTLLVGFFWSITLLHRHCLSKEEWRRHILTQEEEKESTYQFPGRCGRKPTETFQDCWLMGPVRYYMY